MIPKYCTVLLHSKILQNTRNITSSVCVATSSPLNDDLSSLLDINTYIKVIVLTSVIIIYWYVIKTCFNNLYITKYTVILDVYKLSTVKYKEVLGV